MKPGCLFAARRKTGNTAAKHVKSELTFDCESVRKEMKEQKIHKITIVRSTNESFQKLIKTHNP